MALKPTYAEHLEAVLLGLHKATEDRGEWLPKRVVCDILANVGYTSFSFGPTLGALGRPKNGYIEKRGKSSTTEYRLTEKSFDYLGEKPPATADKIHLTGLRAAFETFEGELEERMRISSEIRRINDEIRRLEMEREELAKRLHEPRLVRAKDRREKLEQLFDIPKSYD